MIIRNKIVVTDLKMVTPINLLEAAKVPLFLQTSLKPVEVLSLCHISKEFQKKSQEL